MGLEIGLGLGLGASTKVYNLNVKGPRDRVRG